MCNFASEKFEIRLLPVAIKENSIIKWRTLGVVAELSGVRTFLRDMTLLNYQNGNYALDFMDEDDLRSLLAMIKSASLPERREWNGIKQKIEKIITV